MGAGMKGGDLALMLGMLGGSAIGGLTQPGAQELESFRGDAGIDPRTMLGEAKGLTGDMLTAMLDRLKDPVTMRTTVNQNPSFVGGGLPFAIGATGQDANRMNPALRTTPGINVPRRTLTDGVAGGSSYTPSPNAVDTGRVAVPRPNPTAADASKDDSTLPRIPEMPSPYQLPTGASKGEDEGRTASSFGRRSLKPVGGSMPSPGSVMDDGDMALDSTGRTMKNGGFAGPGQGDPLAAIKLLLQSAGGRG